jgi:molybdopterin molybdotransferase
MISFSQAQENLKALFASWLNEQTVQTERVNLQQALGRYLASPVFASLDLPRDNVSAMDGYALSALRPDAVTAGEEYTLIGESRAGEPYAGIALKAGECVRIFTGAVVPKSANTVVIQEDVSVSSGQAVVINEAVRIGANIRRQGEEIAAGIEIASAGQQMTPNMVPLLASQGVGELEVVRMLRVAFLATGDELKAPGATLGTGDIYESNLASIQAVLGSYRLELQNLGVVEDTPAAISACLARAAESADVVISSGGVSVGDYDFVRQCVESMGVLTDYKVAMKPGKPVCFGHINRADDGRALFLGLPGNAVSSFVVLTELYLPALRYLMNGRNVMPNQQITATLKEDLKRRAGRLEFQRGVLSREPNESGLLVWRVSAFGGQDSHRVLGLARANCTIQIPAEVAEIPAGTEVTVSVFPWFESL